MPNILNRLGLRSTPSTTPTTEAKRSSRSSAKVAPEPTMGQAPRQKAASGKASMAPRAAFSSVMKSAAHGAQSLAHSAARGAQKTLAKAMDFSDHDAPQISMRSEGRGGDESFPWKPDTPPSPQARSSASSAQASRRAPSAELPPAPRMHMRPATEADHRAEQERADYHNERPDFPAEVPDTARFQLETAAYEKALKSAPAASGGGAAERPASGRAQPHATPRAGARPLLGDMGALSERVKELTAQRKPVRAKEAKPAASPAPAQPAPTAPSPAATRPAPTPEAALSARAGKLLDNIDLGTVLQSTDRKALEGLALHLAQGTPFEAKANELAQSGVLGLRTSSTLKALDQTLARQGGSLEKALRNDPSAVINYMLSRDVDAMMKALDASK